MTVKVSGWGRYPEVDAEVRLLHSESELQDMLDRRSGPWLASGCRRAYGDAGLGELLVDTRNFDHLLSFDESTGILTCNAGATLDELIEVFLPRGWFLPVTPGTRYVTVGGAIAADIHGKNHHIDGCFSEFVDWLEVIVADGRTVRCSRRDESELFHATCGGMGLTGIILRAQLRLRRVESAWIQQRSIACTNLEEVLAAFDRHREATYSVAWIDCLAKGADLGRSILMTGEHLPDGDLNVPHLRRPGVPIDLPGWVLNRTTVRAFNRLYYARGSGRSVDRVPYTSFFHPLDAIANWNRIYGRRGFLQYQFVVPREAGPKVLAQVLERIAHAGTPSFLAVLKLFGPANANLLSFPMEGYTLAMDFPATPSTFALLTELDDLVVEAGGRIYLAKDARMSAETFTASYPRLDDFRAVRCTWGAPGRSESLLSRRLGI